MAKIRDILVHVQVDKALSKRICHRNRREHQILKGETCLVVREHGGLGRRNYCRECASPILEAARRRLGGIEAELLR